MRGSLSVWQSSGPAIEVEVRRGDTLLDLDDRDIAVYVVNPSTGALGAEVVWSMTSRDTIGEIQLTPTITATAGLLTLAIIETDGTTGYAVPLGVIDVTVTALLRP